MTSAGLEAADVRALAREVLDAQATPERVRAVVDEGLPFDPGIRAAMDEAEFPALAIPAEFGGLGAGFAALAPVFEELGAHIAPTAFPATALAAESVLRHAPDGLRADWLPRFASGELTGALALFDGSGEPGRPGVRARSAGSGWTLTGTAGDVADGDTAEALCVAVCTPDGDGLAFLAGGAARAVGRRPVAGWDVTRRSATLSFDDVHLAPEHLATVTTGAVSGLVSLGAFVSACDAAGVARAALERTVAYGRRREQFGRPIGSFQAWKHRAANMFIATQAAAAAVRVAARALQADGPDATTKTSLAKFVAADAAVAVAGDAVQLHGGVGYTWEYDVHFLLKRARSARAAFGSSLWHRQQVGAALLANNPPAAFT